MVRKKDKFWDHVEQLEGRFKCKFCNRQYSGGITRIKSHLAGVQGRDIEVCSQVPEEIQAEAFLAIGGPNNKKARHSSSSSNQEDGQIVPSSKGMHQTTMKELSKEKQKELVDKLLAQHIILNNIAFNVLNTLPFNAFVRGVAEYGPSYKLPSYSTLRTKLIPKSRDEAEEYVARVKKTWVKTGCSLMSDIWSDMKQRSFINIVAYSPGGAVFMNSFDVSSEKKTGHYLKGLVSSVIESIGADHVVQFVTDNASNFESAGDMLVGKYPQMYKTQCAAHGIQLLLKDIYEKVFWVQKVFDAAKSIVSYMYKHTIITALMREYTKKELKHPCVTRFASNYQVLQSIFAVEDELRSLVASPRWRAINYNKTEVAIKVTETIQGTEFWSEGKVVLDALEPIVRVLRLVDGDGSTSGYIYEAMERAKEAIRYRCGDNQAKYIRIWTLFEERRMNNILHPVHAAAAFLNPAYMCSENFRESREMKDGISFVLEHLVSAEEKEAFMSQVQLYRMKVCTVFTTTAMTMLKTSHPRVWWDYCGDSLLVLQKHAIRLLSQPCSSSPCERNWSAFEATQTKKRNRLSPIMLDTLVYVRMNTMMMQKFNTLEARDLEPIDLEKLSELPDYIDPPEEEASDSTEMEDGNFDLGPTNGNDDDLDSLLNLE